VPRAKHSQRIGVHTERWLPGRRGNEHTRVTAVGALYNFNGTACAFIRNLLFFVALKDIHPGGTTIASA
jgi:hypothetical protein